MNERLLTFQTDLLLQAEAYITGLITLELPQSRIFHSMEHTLSVVRNVEQLARLAECSPIEIEELVMAAWFHDIGYIRGSREHEHESAAMAVRFLNFHKVKGLSTACVEGLILATKIPTAPTDTLQQLICDADLSHLASASYWMWGLKLKQELELAEGLCFSDDEWTKKNIRFFENHSYYTRYARELWDANKQRNLNILKQF